MGVKWKQHSAEFKARVAMAALSGEKTDAFGLSGTVESARALRSLPGYLVACPVEGERFATGAPPSPGVTQAATEVAEQIIAELHGISPACKEDGGAAAYA